MYGFSLVWLLVLILFRAILEQSRNNKMVSKIYTVKNGRNFYGNSVKILRNIKRNFFDFFP